MWVDFNQYVLVGVNKDLQETSLVDRTIQQGQKALFSYHGQLIIAQ